MHTCILHLLLLQCCRFNVHGLQNDAGQVSARMVHDFTSLLNQMLCIPPLYVGDHCRRSTSEGVTNHSVTAGAHNNSVSLLSRTSSAGLGPAGSVATAAGGRRHTFEEAVSTQEDQQRLQDIKAALKADRLKVGIGCHGNAAVQECIAGSQVCSNAP